jgi:Skp family chaperone for outer membrane proteins
MTRPRAGSPGLQQALLIAALSLSAAACSATNPRAVSAEGKTLCLERMAQAEPGTPLDAKRDQYRSCLQTVEAELASRAKAVAQETAQQQQQQAAANAADQAGWATAAERLIHCRSVQQQIIKAEKQRLQALDPVMRITRIHGVESAQAKEATAVYQRSVNELERLIPEPMRHGLPLLPDAVRLFVRYDAKELGSS